MVDDFHLEQGKGNFSESDLAKQKECFEHLNKCEACRSWVGHFGLWLKEKYGDDRFTIGFPPAKKVVEEKNAE